MKNEGGFLSVRSRFMLRDRVVRLELLLLIVIMLSVLVVYFTVLRPLKAEYSDKYVYVTNLQQRIKEKNQLGSLAREYDKAALVIGVIEEKLSGTFSQAELTRKFDSLARKHGVEVITMNTRSGEMSSGYQSYINEIAFRANYPSIKGLISSFDDLPGLNSVTEISLSKETEIGLVNGKMVLITARAASI